MDEFPRIKASTPANYQKNGVTFKPLSPAAIEFMGGTLWARNYSTWLAAQGMDPFMELIKGGNFEISRTLSSNDTDIMEGTTTTVRLSLFI